MDAINVTDLNVKYVELDKGQWLVDGEIYNNNSYNTKLKVVVSDFDNIRRITDNTFVSHYVCGENKLTVEAYEEQKQLLLSKRQLIDDYYKWDSLDSEFEYRKFIEMWTKIMNTSQEISEPIIVEIVKERQVETGNPYITSEFANGKDTDMFIYNQEAAYHGIVRTTFSELGMKFVDKVNYLQTNGKKVWGNSTHSVIRYVTAFNRYIFNDSFGKAHNVKGTLEQCKARYETDYKNISQVIINGYKEHFGKIEEGKFDFKTLINSLRNASSKLNFSDFKKTGENNYHFVNKSLNNAIKQIEESFKVN